MSHEVVLLLLEGGAALGQTVNLLVDARTASLAASASSFLPSFIRAPIFLDSALRVA